MPYPSGYWYLTVHWQQQEEFGQFGLKFVPPVGTPPTQADVDGAAAAVQTWWTAATSAVPGGYKLAYLRLAPIGADGNYIPGEVAVDHVYAPVVSGGGGTGNNLPPQCTFCVTLRTDFPRGLAHAGRIYLPPLATEIGADLRWPIANVNSAINTISAMLSSLNGSSLGELRVFSKGNAVDPTGESHPVTFINADSRPDVQRRRGKSISRVMSVNANVT